MTIDTPFEWQLPVLRELWKEAFGDTDEFLDMFFTTAFAKERCRCVTIEKEVAAALYWFDCDIKDKPNSPIAYIYAVATAQKFRGQGLCHKLMEDTHNHLKKLGVQGAVLVPGSAKLFRFYEEIGYQTCSRIHSFRCVGKPEDVSFCQIDKREYANLRRQFLPKDGVIQEKENLDFLEKQAKFYAGTDFLLAAYKDGSVLYGVELLGNASVAAGLVHALGCKEGYFRTPGEGIPFAMHISFQESCHMPLYFGLAFD